MSNNVFLVLALVSLLLAGCDSTEAIENSVQQEVSEEIGKMVVPEPINKFSSETVVEKTLPDAKEVVETLLSDEEYKIKVVATELGATKVELTVSTNLPLPVKVSAGISLQGQKPDDTFIGFRDHVTLESAEQTFVLNFTAKPLPSGKYDAEVTFYPRWGAKNGNSIAAEIGTNVEGVAAINLTGGGQNSTERMERDKMQLWIMQNVNPATSYNESVMRSKLGRSEPVAVTRMNPSIISGHYFPKADMTIYVNTLKNEYVTFRKGRDTNGM